MTAKATAAKNVVRKQNVCHWWRTVILVGMCIAWEECIASLAMMIVPTELKEISAFILAIPTSTEYATESVPKPNHFTVHNI